MREWLDSFNQRKVDKEIAEGIRARGLMLKKEMVKQHAFLKNGKRNVSNP